MSAKILIVDDERTIRLTFHTALETNGYQVEEAASVSEAITSLKSITYNLVILDLRIGDESGLCVLEKMRANQVQTPVVMITAYGSIRDAVKAMKLGAIDFLPKPIEPVALRTIVKEILSRHEQPLSKNFHSRAASENDYLSEAKRLINLQNFSDAEHKIISALQLNDRSVEAHNVYGVIHEIAGKYDAARKAYGRAIQLDHNNVAAQQNMRRLFDLFHFGSSDESFNLGKK